MEIQCKDWDWNNASSINVSEEVFSFNVRKDIVASVIKWQRAKARSGNRNTKVLSEVQGTTRKPWAQKETGRSRQGTLRAPHFRGGSVVFGPHPRDFSYKLNKKIKKIGLKSAISARFSEGNAFVLDSNEVPFIKTLAFSKWLESNNIRSVLFVTNAPATVASIHIPHLPV